jgi:DNA polymerase IIIc chi subunit
MPDKAVNFYGICSEFFPIAYRLIEKIYSKRDRLLFLCDNEEEVSFYNSRLWSHGRLSFIPSGNKKYVNSDDATFCYVWFATEIVFDNDPMCLLHNGLDLSQYDSVGRFDKIMDIFSLDLSNIAKDRSQYYHDNLFTDQKIWLQDGNTWKVASNFQTK